MTSKLNPRSIPHLYTDEVYRINPQDDTLKPEPETSQTLIVLDSKGTEPELLEKILGSVSLSIADVDIIAENETRLDKNYDRILLFTENDWENVSIEPYTPSKYGNAEILRADTLSVLKESIPHKKKLWSALKDFFPEP